MKAAFTTLRRLTQPVGRTEALPTRGLRAGRVAAAMTVVLAAASLAWSLNITPGDRMFYPATLLVAVIYGAGCTAIARLTRTALPWRIRRQDLVQALAVGAVLAGMFCVGGFLVRFVPFLQQPVARLLEHARVGSLVLVLLTTVINGIAEEVFYRGALWSVLSPRVRLLGSSVVYTVVTATAGIPLLALAAAVLGVVAAELRRRDGSLVGPVIVHLTWSLIMLFALPHIVR